MLLRSAGEFYPCAASIKCSEDINRFFVYSSLGEAGKKRPFQLKLLKPQGVNQRASSRDSAQLRAPLPARTRDRRQPAPGPALFGGRGGGWRATGFQAGKLAAEFSLFCTKRCSRHARTLRCQPKDMPPLTDAPWECSVPASLPSAGRWARDGLRDGRGSLSSGGTDQRQAPTPRQAAARPRQSRGHGEDAS